MSNVLNEQTKQQIIALGRLGWSLRQIERATGVRRETASAHLKAAGVEPRPPGAWGHPPSAKPAIQVTTGSEPPEAAPQPLSEAPAADLAAEHSPEPAAPTASACEPYREIIAAALAKGRNATAIWQDLVDQSGFPASYQSVKRFVGGLRPTAAAQPCGIIVTDPGQEAQVDYGGDTVPVRDPATGKYRRARLFVLTLGYSRKCVRLLTFQSSTRDWAELHQRAFRALGGVTRTIVLDNLKEGVLSPDIWDPALNPVYRDMLAHYGVVALPCRVNDPDRKGKVERAVGHAQGTPLKGLRFESLELAQAHLDHWERTWADTRGILHGTTKRQVAAMFAEERPALLPLPLEPFRIYQFGNRTVHLDGCVEVEAAYYSVPPGWISRLVAAQWDGHHVRILDPKTGMLLREHIRQERGRHRLDGRDRLKAAPPGIQVLLARAANLGTNTGTLCQSMFQRLGQEAVRRIQGVLALTKKHGPTAVEQACDRALEADACDYRFVRAWLERTAVQLPLGLKQVDPLIRQLTAYRDRVEQLANNAAGDTGGHKEDIPDELD